MLHSRAGPAWPPGPARGADAALAPFIARLQAVADAAHGADQRALVVAQLLAQVAHININDVGVAEIVVAPDPVDDSFPREDLARMSKQHLQQIELTGGQLDLPVAA